MKLTNFLALVFVQSRIQTQAVRDDVIRNHTLKSTRNFNKMASGSNEKLMLKDRCIAAMVLSGVGDALGYKNGDWEFKLSGEDIHKELKNLGGLEKIKVKLPGWMVSDDTVMHLATAEALMEWDEKCSNDKTKLYKSLVGHYDKSMRDMSGRAPGNTCRASLGKQNSKKKDGFRIDFNLRGGGCGAAMRAMCIGIRFRSKDDLQNLIEVSVESGRMTHHNPTGYLGSLAAALFTSYALQGKDVNEWGKGLIETLVDAKAYIIESKEFVEENLDAWDYFEETWKTYLKERNITDGTGKPVFKSPYGPKERDEFYKSVSFSGWGGSSGHDAPMIAYDALLGMQIYKDDVKNRWDELCKRGMFHGGDSDSTGTMAACWYGAIYGYEGVPENNYKHLEYKDRLEKAGEALYEFGNNKKGCQKVNSTGNSNPGEQGNREAKGNGDHGNKDAKGNGDHGNKGATGNGDHGNKGATGNGDHGKGGATGNGDHENKGATGNGDHGKGGATGNGDHGNKGATGNGDHGNKGATGNGDHENKGATGNGDHGKGGATGNGDHGNREVNEQEDMDTDVIDNKTVDQTGTCDSGDQATKSDKPDSETSRDDTNKDEQSEGEKTEKTDQMDE